MGNRDDKKRQRKQAANFNVGDLVRLSHIGLQYIKSKHIAFGGKYGSYYSFLVDAPMTVGVITEWNSGSNNFKVSWCSTDGDHKHMWLNASRYLEKIS